MKKNFTKKTPKTYYVDWGIFRLIT
ncbi:uncharacterized protein METZ01_LOCUS299981, partial [marine metagenome]